MSIVIVKPYYKYKQEAYEIINKLGKSVLKEFGFYEKYPQYLNQDLRIGSDFQRKSGSVSFYLEDLWVFTVLPSGEIIASTVVGQVYQPRKLSTSKFMSLFKNIKVLFKDGKGTVVKALKDNVSEWSVSRERCVFHSYAGNSYVNEG